MPKIRIGTLNCNGLRAAYKKNLSDLLLSANCDILLLQEIRTNLHFDCRPFLDPCYHFFANPAHKAGYSGTLIASRLPLAAQSPQTFWKNLPLCEEGRLIDWTLSESLRVINFYWPSGGLPERQALKVDFLKALQPISLSSPPSQICLIGGDFNIAATDKDLKNWRSNKEQPGCTTEERTLLQQWLEANQLVDSYRVLHKDTAPEEYSWWSYRQKAFEKNVGWRIDTIFISQAHAHLCKDHGFISQPRCSDHALYWLDLQL